MLKNGFLFYNQKFRIKRKKKQKKKILNKKKKKEKILSFSLFSFFLLLSFFLFSFFLPYSLRTLDQPKPRAIAARRASVRAPPPVSRSLSPSPPISPATSAIHH